MKSSHHEQVRRSYANPDQNSPTGGLRQLAEIDEHAKRLGELFENPQDKLRQSLWNKAPAREKPVEKIDYDGGLFPVPGEKNDAENDDADQSGSGRSHLVE